MDGADLIGRIITEEDIALFREFVSVLVPLAQKGGFMLRNDIMLTYAGFMDLHEDSGAGRGRNETSVYNFICRIQELFYQDHYLVILHRSQIARYRFFMLRVDGSYMEEIDISRFLDLKEYHILNRMPGDKHLRIDYLPFYDYSPVMKDAKNLGNGIRYLNRYLSSNIFNRPEEWNRKLFEFMKLHTYNNQQLLVNGGMSLDFDRFVNELENIMGFLGEQEPDTPVARLQDKLKKAGFEPGWGDTAGRILETMQVLADLINEPTDILLEKFLSRTTMPLISKIAVISPHGWFGQENVLGKPDTGGQVIYILDQVRALEKRLKSDIALAGIEVVPAIVVLTRYIPEALGTTCNIRKEKIHGTDNCWILRVPFKDKNDHIMESWISRFHIWPYLEKFAEDAANALLAEFRGRPDLIIGNYSDGNLVASLLSDKLDVIQCTIAHALEKTKYLFSDAYWQGYEKEYNFSLQFVADLLSMNKADFIITSTYQEIAGTEETMGQYESYQFFTMPGLFQVRNGINLYVPRFNVIPPGVDQEFYFPHYEREKRISHRTEYWEKRIFTDTVADIMGELADTERMPLFTMARLDKIKNITGLMEAFGMSEFLKEHCNLIVAAGTIRLEESSDAEERKEIEKMHGLIAHYGLKDRVRWLPSIDKMETGEVYRVIADHRGAFVQPALFEAFGLTILEAMVTGLPTFGPRFGGPVEIIEEGRSGFLLNTSKPELIALGLEEQIARFINDPGSWDSVSRGGIERVQSAFTWELYSERLINLAKLYGFWRYSVSGKGRVKMDRYSDMIYHFLFRKRAEELN
jgi:sucrose synthase